MIGDWMYTFIKHGVNHNKLYYSEGECRYCKYEYTCPIDRCSEVGRYICVNVALDSSEQEYIAVMHCKNWRLP